MLVLEIKGVREATEKLRRIGSSFEQSAQRAMFRVGTLVRRTAVQYAPISPTVGMLRKFAEASGRAFAGQFLRGAGTRKNGRTKIGRDRLERIGLTIGVRAGTVIRLKATKRLPERDVELTQWYADRINDLISKDPRSTGRAQPGGLMRSIMFRATPGYAEIYVPANSPAGSYAYKIHEERYSKWRELGPGSQAKGPQAREKFITRAILDNEHAIFQIVRDEFGSLLKGGR